jgi:hypothetical protein
VKLYVGITDYDWFKLHVSKAKVEEVNFWKPSSQTNFRVLQASGFDFTIDSHLHEVGAWYG